MPTAKVTYLEKKTSKAGKPYYRIGLKGDGIDGFYAYFGSVAGVAKGAEVEVEVREDADIISSLQPTSEGQQGGDSPAGRASRPAAPAGPSSSPRSSGTADPSLAFASYAKDLVVAGRSPKEAAEAVLAFRSAFGDDRRGSMLSAYAKDLVVAGKAANEAIAAIQEIVTALEGKAEGTAQVPSGSNFTDDEVKQFLGGALKPSAIRDAKQQYGISAVLEAGRKMMQAGETPTDALLTQYCAHLAETAPVDDPFA